MKKMLLYGLTSILFLTLILSGCGGSSGSNPPAHTPGEQVIYQANNIPFAMRYVPAKVCPYGASDVVTAPAGPCVVEHPYWMAETEVTYELWEAVYDWATEDFDHNGINNDTGDGIRADNGPLYSIANCGRQGGNTVSGKDPVGDKQHPVTGVNWRDVIIWCNALTEYYNAHNGDRPDLDCVFYSDSDYQTPLRISTETSEIRYINGGEDQPYIKASNSGNIDIKKCTAKGFRLPTSFEWELAARYQGNYNTVGTIEYPKGSGEYWMRGDYVSGVTENCYINPKSILEVAHCNSDSTIAVKSKKANKLGVYDMNGNVWEWSFDWITEWHAVSPQEIGRTCRGGCFGNECTDSKFSDYLRLAQNALVSPWLYDYGTGFRFVKNE